MQYAEMELLGFHKVAYAHTLIATDYAFHIDSHGFGIYGEGPYLGGVLEVGQVLKNPLIFDLYEMGETYMAQEGDLFFVPPNCRINVRSSCPGEHRHTSAEFLIDCRTRFLSEEEIEAQGHSRVKGHQLLLPYVIPAASAEDEVGALLGKIAHDRMFQVEWSYFEECTAFMQIMMSAVRFQSLGRRKADSPPSHKRYCQKAKEYISTNLTERITLDQVAEYVGINKNYLTNVFSACEHVPISEYINRIKLGHMLDLMQKYNHSVKTAGESVGFYDVSYISRIFKKYYGMTIREFRHIANKRV